MLLPSSAEKDRYSTLSILMEHQRTENVVDATTSFDQPSYLPFEHSTDSEFSPVRW